MTQNKNVFKKTGLLVLCGFMVACTAPVKPEPQKPYVEPVAVSKEVQEVTPSEDSLVIPAEIVEDEIDVVMPEDEVIPPGGVILNTAQDSNELVALINDFAFKSEPSFLSCGYNALRNCNQQTVNSKAQETGDVDVCDNMNDENQAEACKAALWNQLAISQKSENLCENIADEFGQKMCVNQVLTTLAKEDVSLCEKIEDVQTQQDCKNNAYLDQAIAKNDAELCENIKQVTLIPSPDNDPENPEVFNFIVEELPEEQNFMKQSCLQMVEMAANVPDLSDIPLSSEGIELTPEAPIDDAPVPAPPADVDPALLIPEPGV